MADGVAGGGGDAGSSVEAAGVAAVRTKIEATLPDLVNRGLDLLIDGECGLWEFSQGGTHLCGGAGREPTARAE
jgi:hypothetical protein